MNKRELDNSAPIAGLGDTEGEPTRNMLGVRYGWKSEAEESSRVEHQKQEARL